MLRSAYFLYLRRLNWKEQVTPAGTLELTRGRAARALIWSSTLKLVRSLKRSGYYLAVARKHARTPDPVPGQPLTAVLVEDDANLAKFVSSYLAFGGFTVRTAANRADVLAEFRKPPVPNLVLLDVMLPDVDGFEVLGSLRRHPAFRNVPVIMLTGKATRESVLRGLYGGADGYVTKPFEPDALMAAVRTVLGLPPAA
ncbi:MAG: response regulator [Comamonadaceae bacterium]|nr:MAG: response regulator [Comamonadaceae bacterium]